MVTLVIKLTMHIYYSIFLEVDFSFYIYAILLIFYIPPMDCRELKLYKFCYYYYFPINDSAEIGNILVYSIEKLHVRFDIEQEISQIIFPVRQAQHFQFVQYVR